MLRATLRSLAARKVRLALTAFAIVLGVSFVTGTLVLTDTSSRLFDDQFAQATAGVDVVVRDAATFDAAYGVEVDRDPVTAEVAERVRRTDGVAGAEGVVRGSALIVADGEPIVPAGPSVGLSWSEPPYSPFLIDAGRPPAGPSEVVVDRATATATGIDVGDGIDIALDDGTHPHEVVGIVTFGDADGIPDTTVALFTAEVAHDLYGTAGGWSEIQVIADGVTVETLRERLAAQLGDGFEIATSQDTAAASAAAAQDQLLYLQILLYVLAATALLVGSFMIANTFAIVVAQRTREFATLRALGASSRQVLTSVLVEAATVGTVASGLGVAIGIAAASGLRTVAGAFGVALPDGPLTVEPRTLLVGLALGVTVTLASAVVPARRAARTAPVTAMRNGSTEPRAITRKRAIAGVALAASSAGALTAGATTASVVLVGAGGVGSLVAIVVLAPAFAGRLASVVGRLLPDHLVARMARTNVRRAAKRTAATSTALALGLAVVTFMTVAAASAKSGITDAVDDVIAAELFVESARGEMLGGLSPHLFDEVSRLPDVEVASRMRYGHWQDENSTLALTAIEPQTFTQLADLEMIDGQLSALDRGGIVLSENVANARGLTVGDEMLMRFSRTGEQHLEVVGITDPDDARAISSGYIISLDTFATHFAEDVDATIFLKLAPAADLETTRTEVEQALTEFPTAVVHDQEAAKTSMTAMLDSMLGLVTVLLLLAVLIALLGITNALALSIVERTREVGMLRAVGMTRPQIRWMVRTEAALTAVVGALVGIALGLVLATGTVRALAATDVLPLTVPALQLIAYLTVAVMGGVAAGLVPGRRASRTDVLAAIASK